MFKGNIKIKSYMKDGIMYAKHRWQKICQFIYPKLGICLKKSYRFVKIHNHIHFYQNWSGY